MPYFYSIMARHFNPSFFIAGRLASYREKSFTGVILGIAVVSLAISTAVMIMSSAIITGFKEEIHAKIFGFWGHIHVSDAGVTRNFDLRPLDINGQYYRELKQLNGVSYSKPMSIMGYEIPALLKEYQTNGGITTVNPYIIMPCLLENKKDIMAGLFKGLADDFDWSSMQRFMVEGRGLMPADSTTGVVISKIIANKLSVKSGGKLVVSFVKDNVKIKRVVNIRGIYNTGLEEYDERFIIGSAGLLRSILGWSETQYSGIELFANDVKDVPIINEFIYAEILPSQLYSETIFEKFPSIFEWLNLQDINERVILQLMGLVAMINLTTVILILIMERTRMVGLLKALGADNWTIRKVFLYHAAYILIIGLTTGNVLGLSLAFLQQKTGFVKLDEANYYLSVAPISIDVMQIILINVIAFAVCMITLILPSVVVSRIRPVKALRFN